MLHLTDEQQIVLINKRLSDFIYKYMAEHDISVKEFQARAGLSERYIYQIDPNSIGTPRAIRISSLIKIARLNNMTLDDFIQYLLYEKDKKDKHRH